MKTFVVFLLSLLVSAASVAQELNCRVEINTSQLEGTNKSVFETLQNAVNEYVNTTQWTNTQFSPNEKIECTLFFTITKYDESTGAMEGSLQVQSIRPVYNSFRDKHGESAHSDPEFLYLSDSCS